MSNPQRHHRRCAAWKSADRYCNRNCAAIQKAIDEFNGNPAKTYRDDPDSREHLSARFPILAEDCDYEISGFSGVQGRRL